LIKSLPIEERLRAIFQQTHCYRRSSAQHLQSIGIRLDAIQNKLGHTDMGTTAIYLKASTKEAQKNYLEALNNEDKRLMQQSIENDPTGAQSSQKNSKK